MKNGIKIKNVAAFMCGLCLSGLVSVAEANWHDCNLAANQVLGSGAYVCCGGKRGTGSNESVLTLTKYHAGAEVICMARNNTAWFWKPVGYENGCNQFWNPHSSTFKAWRCEQK
ncbi:MAG: hypothetical protein JSS53_00205 [Proteobacteria bacterium]|nr:hypothetical protein [Pseudomonadota bacterium]